MNLIFPIKTPTLGGDMLSKFSAIIAVMALLLPAAAMATIHQINITGFAFVPGKTTITQGDTVQWTNLDATTHTSTSDNGVWNSGNITPSQSFSFGFTSSGTFPYHCNIHHSMMDTITVLPQVDWTINIGEFFFNPAVLQIQPGQSVRWVNNGARIHTSTSNDGFWNSDSIAPGGHFDHTFPTEGVFHYHCEMHPSLMKATVIVSKPDSVAFDIHIVDFAFAPADTAISVGQNIRWINFGTMQNTTTDTSANLWNSGPLNPGDVFTLHASQPGVYHYICNIHTGMAGTLVVRDTTTPPPADWTINIGDYFFNPAMLQIQPGQSVRWLNNGLQIHTSTSNDGFWNSDSIPPGGHYNHTFPNEGVFHYHCEMHPSLMKGTIIVSKPDSVAFDIHIAEYTFTPAETTISVGQNIRWINSGTMEHTTTDTSAHLWDSGVLNPGDVFTLHASQPGVYHYICNIHNFMTGTLTVLDTVTSPGCVYVTGDINHSGLANGVDVVYGVSYFKGGPLPPVSCECATHGQLFVAGDVNGSCSFNGIDIVYFVTYLKGGPHLASCPDCPSLGASPIRLVNDANVTPKTRP
jgi:plastocyanin